MQLLIQEFIVAKDAGTKWLPMPEIPCLHKTIINTAQAKAPLDGICWFTPKQNKLFGMVDASGLGKRRPLSGIDPRITVFYCSRDESGRTP
ncbi:MAG TPA: hypothetical protein VGM58_04655 [Verrucomicrobiae bacterium]